MTSAQRGEIFGETAVCEERTMEGAVEVITKTPIAANDGLVWLPCHEQIYCVFEITSVVLSMFEGNIWEPRFRYEEAISML